MSSSRDSCAWPVHKREREQTSPQYMTHSTAVPWNQPQTNDVLAAKCTVLLVQYCLASSCSDHGQGMNRALGPLTESWFHTSWRFMNSKLTLRCMLGSWYTARTPSTRSARDRYLKGAAHIHTYCRCYTLRTGVYWPCVATTYAPTVVLDHGIP